MKEDSLKSIKAIYEKGGNIVRYLKRTRKDLSAQERILISYDFQSGNYVRRAKKNPRYIQEYAAAIARVIAKLGVRYDSLLEVGVGEATTLESVIHELPRAPRHVFGLDISWSRVRYAAEYLKKKRVKNSFVFTGDLFHIPLADNSMDIVYTSHSIEPNGGREKEALRELIRVTRKYLILLEPAYEFANTRAKRRMEGHGYIKNLYKFAAGLGMQVVEHRPFDISFNPMNPTGLTIVKKDLKTRGAVRNPLICPVTRTPLQLIKGSYFSREGLLAYPVIEGVPCLLRENAVVATHYGRKIKV